MAVVKVKATTPGQRHKIKIVKDGIHKGAPYRPLTTSKSKTGGRNNLGRITTRHIGGGHKQKYRIIDFKRDKDNIKAKVERIEHDPNRNAYIALLSYADGEKRYIIAQKKLEAGMTVESGDNAAIEVGNALKIRNIPVGSVISCVEMKPKKGAQMARSAGASVQLIAKEEKYAILRLRSGEVRKVLLDCKATIGEVGNAEFMLKRLGKAGAKRWLGVRPTVRGVVMNPVDHPHGGGEGKTSGGRHPVTPWGVPTKGYKTRKNKQTEKYIVKRRNKK